MKDILVESFFQTMSKLGLAEAERQSGAFIENVDVTPGRVTFSLMVDIREQVKPIAEKHLKGRKLSELSQDEADDYWTEVDDLVKAEIKELNSRRPDRLTGGFPGEIDQWTFSGGEMEVEPSKARYRLEGEVEYSILGRKSIEALLASLGINV